MKYQMESWDHLVAFGVLSFRFTVPVFGLRVQSLRFWFRDQG